MEKLLQPSKIPLIAKKHHLFGDAFGNSGDFSYWI